MSSASSIFRKRLARRIAPGRFFAIRTVLQVLQVRSHFPFAPFDGTGAGQPTFGGQYG
ncbi:hypothetical protein BMF35_a2135 [Aurantiacibacter gangjinensis]|nr:hypothetical protein BMF35_a2135 [Aurantiacibacter gangjinensis]